jgi:predicted secreted hydrolase
VDGYDLDLDLTAIRPPVNSGGFQAFCNNAKLYARERVPTVGTLRHGGATTPVSGSSHFFHLWGFTPAFLVANVTAFTFELDDGRDALLADLRLREGGEEYSYRFGTLTQPDGSSQVLHRGDFDLTPGRRWRRDAACSYPVDWKVRIHDESLTVRPALESTELRPTDPVSLVLFPEWPNIWDGETIVGGDATGTGWLDMTHYCYL